jgi:hypothetical protein
MGLVVSPAGALEPVQDRLTISMPAGATIGTASMCVSGIQGTPSCVITVPAGKRLVIEAVSAQVDVPIDQRVGLKVRVRAGGKEVEHDFVLGLVARSTQDWFVGNHLTRLYADPGSPVRVTVIRTGSAGGGNAIVNLSGQLVPADQGAVLVSPDGSYRLTVSNTGIVVTGPSGSSIGIANGSVVIGGQTIQIQADVTAELSAPVLDVRSSGILDVRGGLLLLNGGCRPVARVADLVNVPAAPSSAPIATGSPTVLSC